MRAILILNLLGVIYDWYRQASADGVITEDEARELMNRIMTVIQSSLPR